MCVVSWLQPARSVQSAGYFFAEKNGNERAENHSAAQLILESSDLCSSVAKSVVV